MDNNLTVSVIREELKKRKMTYKELSDLSGVPLDTLNNFFRGKTRNPRIDTMQAIERALGIRPKLEWTEEDRAAGMADGVQITVNAEMFEWNELGERIIAVKGEEFFKTLKKMLEASMENN